MTPHPPKQHVAAHRSHRGVALAGIGALGLFAAIGIGVSVGGEGTAPASSIVETGEVSAMGTPVIETPGSSTGTEPVLVGEPHPEVREGCCPGAFSIDTTTIAPGESTTLGFELSMHTGMDGWHDIAVHVPLRAGSTDHVLEVDVNGDFTDT